MRRSCPGNRKPRGYITIQEGKRFSIRAWKKGICITLAALLWNTCAVTQAAEPTAAQEVLSEHQLANAERMALMWMRTSAEYRALCYQCYNTALMEVDRALADTGRREKPLAIVLDPLMRCWRGHSKYPRRSFMPHSHRINIHRWPQGPIRFSGGALSFSSHAGKRVVIPSARRSGDSAQACRRRPIERYTSTEDVPHL